MQSIIYCLCMYFQIYIFKKLYLLLSSINDWIVRRIHAMLPFNLAKKTRCFTRQLPLVGASAWEKACDALKCRYIGSSLCFGTEPLCILRSSLNHHCVTPWATTIFCIDEWIQTEDAYLLLSQNQYPLWFDWMIRGQTVPISPHYTILISFPHSISSGPCDTNVMPFPIVDQER